ncbi:MAG: hypothetical protein IVW57_05880 [Ktedonobacterales bacterium]|nr:hypothetical protein [Ktedonobacterales bacterium]
MDELVARRIGAVTTLAKQVSEADVALFALVMGQAQLNAEDPAIPARTTRQVVPMALISALLASVAARHSSRPGDARLVSETVSFIEAAYTDDLLTATAEISGYESGSRALRIRARCETQDGRRLAEGEYLLNDL